MASMVCLAFSLYFWLVRGNHCSNFFVFCFSSSSGYITHRLMGVDTEFFSPYIPPMKLLKQPVPTAVWKDISLKVNFHDVG